MHEKTISRLATSYAGWLVAVGEFVLLALVFLTWALS